MKFTLPELVFLSQSEYNTFKNGDLVPGNKVLAGVTSSAQLLLEVVGKGDSHYEFEDKTGTRYAIEFDLDKFYELHRQRNQPKLAFYRLII